MFLDGGFEGRRVTHQSLPVLWSCCADPAFCLKADPGPGNHGPCDLGRGWVSWDPLPIESAISFSRSKNPPEGLPCIQLNEPA